VVSQAVGTGTSGSGAEENEYPTNSTVNQPMGMVLIGKTSTYGGSLVWADQPNYRIRIYNRDTVSHTYFGVTVDAGKVANIGGDGTSGNATSGSALQAAFDRPGGVAFDGTNLYVADTYNHCIKMIDPTGTLSAVAGTCGTSGNVNGPVGTGRMTYPYGLDYYENGTHKGIVIAAEGNARLKFYRIAGSSLLFGGSISVGDTNSIACGGTFHTEGINASLATCSGVYDVATVGTSVCFVNETYYNVRCVDQSGTISTVIGAPEGIDDSTALYFPGTSLADATYDSAHPNYAAQNGVLSFFLPSPLAEPALTDSFGKLTYPIALTKMDSNTIAVGEYNLGLVRKVKIP
jgi:hypothetical protein